MHLSFKECRDAERCACRVILTCEGIYGLGGEEEKVKGRDVDRRVACDLGLQEGDQKCALVLFF